MANRKAALSRYNASSKGQAAQQKYRGSEKYRERARESARARRDRLTKEEREALRAKKRGYYRAAVADPERKSRMQATLKRNYARRKSAGICISCTDLAQAGTRCLLHWCESIGKNYGHTIANGGAQALLEMWHAQRGLCRLTGEPMLPGSTARFGASVDHIVPQSRGGDHSLRNLQWVTRSVNAAKNDLTSEEFIALCKVIAERHKDAAVVPLRKVL